jgi:peptidoglycan-N-acetylmuramic acid deacetylase
MRKTITTLIFAMFLFTCNVFAASWGVHFPKDGGRPEGNATAGELAQFDAFFIGDESEQVIYLTFDAGYENGYTSEMLDTLKKHDVTAAFFVVGTYIRDEPELVMRMINEGHIVANHTMSHPDMSKISVREAFAKELTQVEEIYRQLTGDEIPKFYRPPRGIYNERNLKHAQEMGYKTVFWTTAYMDWDVKKQPSKDEAFKKLFSRTQNGAIILLHNVSKTNAQILDELLTRYKEMGYRFESLDSFK